jgi:hypothetical protein
MFVIFTYQVDLIPYYLMILIGILGFIGIGLYILYLLFRYLKNRRKRDNLSDNTLD